MTGQIPTSGRERSVAREIDGAYPDLWSVATAEMIPANPVLYGRLHHGGALAHARPPKCMRHCACGPPISGMRGDHLCFHQTPPPRTSVGAQGVGGHKYPVIWRIMHTPPIPRPALTFGRGVGSLCHLGGALAQAHPPTCMRHCA